METNNKTISILFLIVGLLVGLIAGFFIGYNFQGRGGSSSAASQSVASSSDIDSQVTTMLTEMFNNALFEDDAWLESHCTQRCLSYLQQCYDNEYCDGGPAYGTWVFRTMAQDGDGESKILSVENAGDGYYDYTFLDMGFQGTNRVKVVEEGGQLLIDEIINLEPAN